MSTVDLGRQRHGVTHYRPERGSQERKDHKTFRVNPVAVAAGMAGLIALDMTTTQLFFNIAHTNSTFAEKSLIGQTVMNGGNSVFTPQTIALKTIQFAYDAGPYLALKAVSYANRDKPNSWMHAGTNIIANAFTIGPLTSGIYTGVTNSWDVLHAAGALPTYAPWQDNVNSALQYWVYDAHMIDAPLEGFMRYWDFADSTGLGLGKFTLLAGSTAAVATGGTAFAINQYKKSHPHQKA